MRDVYALMINNIIAVGYQTTRWSPARQCLKHLRDTLFKDLLEPARRAWCCLFYGWVLSPFPLIYFAAPSSVLFTAGFFHASAQMPPWGIHRNVTLPKVHQLVTKLHCLAIKSLNKITKTRHKIHLNNNSDNGGFDGGVTGRERLASRGLGAGRNAWWQPGSSLVSVVSLFSRFWWSSG